MKFKHVFMIAAVMLALLAAPASAANEAILGYDVPETYSITIPATMAFDVNNPITVKGSLADSTSLNVSVDSGNDWVVKNGASSIGYSMTVDESSITTTGENGAVVILSGLRNDIVSGNGKTSNLVFTLSGEATKAGKYTDTLTFSVDVIRAIDSVKSALATGGSVTISEDIFNSENDKSTQLLASVDGTTINLGSHKIIQTAKYDSSITGLINQNAVGLYVTGENVVLNADSNGGISADFYTIFVLEGGSLTIKGGTYKAGDCTVVNVAKGTVIIEGGFFESGLTYEGNSDPYAFAINCLDSFRQNGEASIVIKGGTFVNFNPANNRAEGTNTNFVPEGYTVISESQSNGNVWYTVVAVSEN